MQIAAGITAPFNGTAAAVAALSGWPRATALDSLYPKGTAAGVDPDVPGGAATHTHVDPGHTHTVGAHTHGAGSTGSGVTVVFGNGGSFGAAPHTHTIGISGSNTGTSTSTAGGWGGTASDPAYNNVIWIASDGTPTGFPPLSWVFWDQTGALPTGWSLPAAGKNVFLKGAAPAGDGGGTGGGGAHIHAGQAHTHAFNNHTHTGGTTGSTGATAFINTGVGAAADVSAVAHTHAWTLASGSTQANTSTSGDPGSTTYEPPWTKLAIVQNDTGVANIQVNMIALYTGLLSTIPTNWILCDGTNSTIDMRGQFVKGANVLGEIGNTGGTAGHSHANPSGHTHAYDHSHPAATGGPSAEGVDAVTASSTAVLSTGHTHPGGASGTATGTSGSGIQTAPSTADTQPPFRTTAFIKVTSTLTATITVPAAAAVLTNAAPTITWTLSGGSGVQNDYRVKVYESDGTTVRYDSGQIASASQSISLSLAANLQNNSSYYFEVTVHDTSTPAQSAVSAKVHVTTAWTPPAVITGVRAGKGITSEVDIP